MTNNTQTNDVHTADLRGLLAEKLPNTVLLMQDALRELEVHYLPTIEARIKAQAELSNKRLQYVHPKDAALTDMDRKIMLDAHTNEAQADYERLAGLEKALELRVDVMKTLLNFW